MPEAVTDNPPHFLVTRFSRVCAAKGIVLAPGARLLDFGCGNGELVYVFRAAGFDCYGCDIHDYLGLRRPEDRRYFSIMAAESVQRDNSTVDWDRFQLPYESATFDFIFSLEVFEHVLDHASVLKEIARVLKPEGASIHSFPSKFRLIEPHLRVPGGSLFKSAAYFLPWALLGIRNEHQGEWSAMTTACLNSRYAHTGINYLSPWRLRHLARQWFERCEFVPDLWEVGGPLERRLARSGFARNLYTLTNSVIWLLAAPRTQRGETLLSQSRPSNGTSC
jgi:2-polyprenyl-3-methyl-5-hydroxy-6-metoxy-1,4-benzoquinol methylase